MKRYVRKYIGSSNIPWSKNKYFSTNHWLDCITNSMKNFEYIRKCRI